MKPIMLTDDLIQQIREEIMSQMEEKLSLATLKKDAEESLGKLKMSDGSFKFLREFKYEKNFKYQKSDRRATITIDPVAYGKMLTIIMSQTEEVGWHGVIERTDKDSYLLTDILVYPQQVSAANIDTDEEEYAQWLIGIDDDVFPKMHFHGHSHVNMDVGPSSTDMGHRQKITSQLRPKTDDFYVFMIWNKRLEWSGAVYDMATNTLFDTEDIDVVVPLGNQTAGELIDDLKEKVTRMGWNGGSKNGVTPMYPTYGTGYTAYQKTTPPATNPATGTPLGSTTKTESEKKKEVSGIGNDPDDFRNPPFYGSGAGSGYRSGYRSGYSRYDGYSHGPWGDYD